MQTSKEFIQTSMQKTKEREEENPQWLEFFKKLN